MPIPAKPSVPETEYEEWGWNEEEDGPDPSTYQSMTLDELTAEKERVETLFATVRKQIPVNGLGWADCVTRINKLKALIVAGVLNK